MCYQLASVDSLQLHSLPAAAVAAALDQTEMTNMHKLLSAPIGQLTQLHRKQAVEFQNQVSIILYLVDRDIVLSSSKNKFRECQTSSRCSLQNGFLSKKTHQKTSFGMHQTNEFSSKCSRKLILKKTFPQLIQSCTKHVGSFFFFFPGKHTCSYSEAFQPNCKNVKS